VLTARDRGTLRPGAEELAEVERQARLRFKAGEIPASDLAAPPRAGPRARPASPQPRAPDHRRADYARLTGHARARWRPARAAPGARLWTKRRTRARANPALAQAEKGVDIARAGHRAAKAERLPTWAPLPRRPTPATSSSPITAPMRWWWARALDDLGWWAHRRRIDEADAHLDASEARARDAARRRWRRSSHGPG
jgi:outer membrane protein